MNTISVTCPVDREQFAVVEPDNHSEMESLSATCPSCGEQLTIVYPDNFKEKSTNRQPYERYSGGIVEWEQREDAPAPYTGRQEAIPFEQYISAKVEGMGGAPVSAEAEDTETLSEALKPDRFQFWYTPEHDEIRYVVRADFETGVKTKNVYSQGGGLYVKNRGVPRDSDKQWTYLSRDECYARVAQAQLLGEITQTEEGKDRFNIFLGNKEQPLINSDGELSEELVLELARMLTAFQTKRID